MPQVKRLIYKYQFHILCQLYSSKQLENKILQKDSTYCIIEYKILKNKIIKLLKTFIFLSKKLKRD